MHIAVMENSAPTEIVGCQVCNLLRRARTLDGHGWLGEQGGPATREGFDGFPGVLHSLRRVVAAYAVGADGILKAFDSAPVHHHTGADNEEVIGEVATLGEANLIGIRINIGGVVLNPNYPVRNK
jgi:hypothetical protein